MSMDSYRSDTAGPDALWPQALTAEAARATDRFAPPGSRAPHLPENQPPDGRADARPPRLVLCSRSPRRQSLLALCGRPFETAAANLPEKALESAVVQVCGALPIRLTAAMATLALATAKARTVRSADQDVRRTDPDKPRRSAPDAHGTGSSDGAPDNTRGSASDCASGNTPARAPDNLYIGSDTLVLTEDAVLGKPADPEEARRMLLTLSGRTHHVLTAVCLLRTDAEGRTRSEQTHLAAAAVTFHPADRCQKELIDRYVAGGSPLDKAGGYGIQDAGALLIDGISGDYYTVMGLPVAWLNRALMSLAGPMPSAGASAARPRIEKSGAFEMSGTPGESGTPEKPEKLKKLGKPVPV